MMLSDGESSPWSLASSVAAAVAAVALLWLAAWTLEWGWRTPRRLDRALRAQGLSGTRYRLFTGDLPENARRNREAWSKPLPLGSHDIVPYVFPMLWDVVKEHGKLSFSWFGSVPKVTITDPELVKEVFTNKSGHYGKANNHRLGKLLVRGTAGLEGERWAMHRRILNPAFHHEKIKLMHPIFSACCVEMIRRWENSTSSEGLSELDVWLEFQNLTGDVISKTAFGSNYQEGRRIFLLQQELVERAMQSAPSLFIPGYWFLPTKNNRRIRTIERVIHSILKVIIGKRNRAIRNGEASNNDLLGLLLESNMRESNGKAQLGMSMKDMIEECRLFYLAGTETTSVLLTWTLILLSMHPEWQERAREEVFHHFGRASPDFENMSRLKIVNMILYEVLRLYPPTFSLTRRTYKETELGGIKYPAGVYLMLPLIFIHHDPNIWGKDAVEFNPERFANGISNATNYQSAFVPFGGGPRICIGQNFALLEAKMALISILQRFSFQLSPSYIHAPRIVISLQPQHGAQIMLKKL